MVWIQIQRMMRTGFINFWRDGFISLASVLVMTITLVTLGLVLFTGAILKSSLLELEEKVDISVYFLPSVSEEEVLPLQKSLEAMNEVKEVIFTTRDEALRDFEKRHENDQVTLQALDELGENPFGASLNIKAREPSQYESIAKFLESKSEADAGSGPAIEKINYYKNKASIERLMRIIDASKKLGFAIIAILALTSILITFNTLRLAIYNYREEISVMRLVGASRKYIRGPFVVSGIMYGVASGLVAMVIFYPLSIWLGGATENFFGGINVAEYYINNFFELLLVIAGSGVILGALSSFLAVRKYLGV